MLSRVAAWQQRDCDADCDCDSGSNSKLFMRDLMATSFFLVFVYFVLLLDFVNLATLHTHLHRMERERGAGWLVQLLLACSDFRSAHTRPNTKH